MSLAHRPGAAALLCALLALLAALAPAPARAQADQRCFPETGQCISGRIREYWEQNGGLAVFGFPLSSQFEEQVEGRPLQVQWFERHRLELHPENARPYDVLIGRAGADALARQGRDWQGFRQADPDDGDAERCRLFRETVHTVCDEFLSAYRSYGLDLGQAGVSDAESLALFGLPIAQPTTEVLSDGRQYTVQWFERARFELHPENQPPYRVLFGLLGAELLNGPVSPLGGSSWALSSYGDPAAPTPAAASERPATISFGTDGRASGSSGCNGFGGDYSFPGANRIDFAGVVSTLIACEDPIGAQERVIFEVLNADPIFELGQGSLQLRTSEGGNVLNFSAGEPAARAAVTGTLIYRDRSALPPNAVATVQLVDVSLADAPARVIATQVISPAGQVPIAFSLPYDPAAIDERFTYAVQARIEVEGQLRYINTSAYPVITRGNPTTVEVLLERAGG